MLIQFFVPGKPATAGSKRSMSIWKGGHGLPPLVKMHATTTMIGVVFAGEEAPVHNKCLMVDKNCNPLLRTFDDCATSKAWMRMVSKLARQEMCRKGYDLLDEPLDVAMRFYLDRPKGHTTATGKISKQGAINLHPTKKPDLLKMARAVEDAMTGVIYKDDASIVREILEKVYIGTLERGVEQGVLVTITPTNARS